MRFRLDKMRASLRDKKLPDSLRNQGEVMFCFTCHSESLCPPWQYGGRVPLQIIIGGAYRYFNSWVCVCVERGRGHVGTLEGNYGNHVGYLVATQSLSLVGLDPFLLFRPSSSFHFWDWSF
jgi:hypothetical protein